MYDRYNFLKRADGKADVSNENEIALIKRIILILGSETKYESMRKENSIELKEQQKITRVINTKKSILSGQELISESDQRKHLYRMLLLAVLLSVLVFFTYRKSFSNNFVDWDDFTYVINNDLVRHPGDNNLKEIFTIPVSSNYHPLAILSMQLNNNECKTCPNGISAVPFISWNVILHMLNTILVFVLIYLISSRDLSVSFLVAAIFGLHPMHVESVAWISERKDVLSSFFFLSGLISYLNYKIENGKKYLWLAVAFLLFVLACLSKATAVVFPLILFLLNFWYSGYHDDKSLKESIKETLSFRNLIVLVPFLAVSFILGMVAYRLQSGQNYMGIMELSKNAPDVVNKIGPFSIIQRLQVGCYGFVTYLIKFFLPVHLSSFHPYPGTKEFDSQTISTLIKLAPLAFILLSVAVFISLRKTKLFVFGVGFYFLTIMLVLQFISVGYAIIADRYTYLPYIGLSFVLAVLLVKVTGDRKYLFYIISSVIIILLVTLSVKQTEIWHNTETLWTSVIDKFPHVEISRRSRAKYYSKLAFQSKTLAEKRSYEDKSLADFLEAMRSGSKNSEVYQGAGVIYGSKGEMKTAILCFNNAIKIDPKKGEIYYNRALTYGNMKLNEEAIRDYNIALVYSPQKAVEILNNRSNIFLSTGRFKEAIEDLDFLISTDNRNFLYYYNRALARQQTGNISGAIADLQYSLQLQPEDKIAQLQLEKLLQNKK